MGVGEFPEIRAGQSVRLNWRKQDLRMECCACGLRHRVQFAIVDNCMSVRMWRDGMLNGIKIDGALMRDYAREFSEAEALAIWEKFIEWVEGEGLIFGGIWGLKDMDKE